MNRAELELGVKEGRFPPEILDRIEFTREKPCANPDCKNVVSRLTYCTKKTQAFMEKAFDEAELYCDPCEELIALANERIEAEKNEPAIQKMMEKIKSKQEE